MLPLLLTAISWLCAGPATTATDAPTHGSSALVQGSEGHPVKAASAWLKLYHKGKIDYRSDANISKESIALKYDLAPPTGLGNPTWAGDLKLILDALVTQSDAEAVRALAEFAAVGLDDAEYSYAMAPYSVRSAALDAIARLKDGGSKELAVGARGEWKADRKEAVALRSAALLGLGRIGDHRHRDVLEAALADGNELVRIHAIEGLGHLGGEDTAPALIGVVEREAGEAPLIAAVKALRVLYGKVQRDAASAAPAKKGDAEEPAADKADSAAQPPPPASARLAVRAAIQALGRTSWRADMELVRLLDEFRSAETVPALVAVLERFRDNPADIESGKLSGLLRFQVHELLVSMTGAVFSADQPEKWRELWEKEKDNIQVANKRTEPGPAGTSAAGFAGIPVTGTRVVFVLDLSGSMEWPMEEAGTDGRRQRVRRIDYAKRELMQAVEGLAPDAMFNLVTFNGDDRAEVWSKKLVPANKRNKERFKSQVEKLRPLGGTNLWSGVEQALDIKSLVYGNRYDTSVDELFILSDGAPTVGEVIDPVEILRLTAEVNRFRNVRINTVFISSATPPEQQQAERQMSLTPKELMKRMAEQNGGKFRDV